MSETIAKALNVLEHKTTVGELILRAIDAGAGRIEYRFTTPDGDPVAAVVAIAGEHTKDYLTAMDDEAERLECAGEPRDE